MKHAVKCAACGKTDVSFPGHVGTGLTMRCKDCGDPVHGCAMRCRDCCPTGHGTRFDDEIANETV